MLSQIQGRSHRRISHINYTEPSDHLANWFVAKIWKILLTMAHNLVLKKLTYIRAYRVITSEMTKLKKESIIFPGRAGVDLNPGIPQ